jgi:hypothetical protein
VIIVGVFPDRMDGWFFDGVNGWWLLLVFIDTHYALVGLVFDSVLVLQTLRCNSRKFIPSPST